MIQFIHSPPKRPCFLWIWQILIHSIINFNFLISITAASLCLILEGKLSQPLWKHGCLSCLLNPNRLDQCCRLHLPPFPPPIPTRPPPHIFFFFGTRPAQVMHPSTPPTPWKDSASGVLTYTNLTRVNNPYISQAIRPLPPPSPLYHYLSLE